MIKSFKHKGLADLFEKGSSRKIRQDLHSRALRRLDVLGGQAESLMDLNGNMEEYYIKRPIKRPPVHPGEILREDVLQHLGLSVSEAARRLGVSRQQLHRVLSCTHPITIEMALRIGKFAGNGPGLWLRMQQAYDLWHAEHRMADELSKIESASSDRCNA